MLKRNQSGQFSEREVHAILVQRPLPKHIDEALVLSKKELWR